MTTVDLIYTKLRAAGYDGTLIEMLNVWRDDNGVSAGNAYAEYVIANSSATNFADAESEFWAAYTPPEE